MQRCAIFSCNHALVRVHDIMYNFSGVCLYPSLLWFFFFSCLLFKSQLPGTGIILNCKTCQDARTTWVRGATSKVIISRDASEAPCHHLVTRSATRKERRKAAQKRQHSKGKKVCFKRNKQQGLQSLHRLAHWDTILPGIHVIFHSF